jgi:hypothetical protein
MAGATKLHPECHSAAIIKDEKLAYLPVRQA